MFDKIKDAASGGGDVGQVGDLKKYVEGIDFPASKDQVLSQLRESGAQEDLITRVKQIGKDQFSSQTDLVSSFLGDRK